MRCSISPIRRSQEVSVLAVGGSKDIQVDAASNLAAIRTALENAGHVDRQIVNQPESIPIHWNLRGKADGWLDKPLGVLVWPAGVIAVYVPTPPYMRRLARA